jgi:small conductance mechanosensitive channel
LSREIRRFGEYEIAPIYSPLDGSELFDVTSPTILDQSKIPETKLPVEFRAQAVNERLELALQRTITSKHLPIVSIATLNQELIILFSDDRSSRPLPLVTVTEPDAEFNGKTLAELAQDWQAIIGKEVRRFRELAAPGVFSYRLGQAFLIFLGLIVSSGLIWGLHRLLTLRQRTLQRRLQEELAAITAQEKSSLPPTVNL